MIKLTFNPLNKSQDLCLWAQMKDMDHMSWAHKFFSWSTICSACCACKTCKKLLKMKKIHIIDHFNLFGHFRGLATGIIINGSPPWTMGMLVQYHTHLAWFSKLCKFTQYMWKLLKNKQNPYYLTVSTFLVTLKVQPLGLLYMAALLGPWACLYNTILTFPGP